MVGGMRFTCVVVLLILAVACFSDGFNAVNVLTKHHSRQRAILSVSTDKDEDFWKQQKELAAQMTESSTNSLRQEQMKKFEKRRLALVGDTAYFSLFVACSLWTFFPSPATTFSYGVGAVLGLAYAYGLGKSVEQLGVMPTEATEVERSGFGEARFAFLILLFVVVGKFRNEGLQEIPAIGGFFTYQLASLKQGLQEIND